MLIRKDDTMSDANKSNVLLILGNGFDRECGLNSSFSQYLSTAAPCKSDLQDIVNMLKDIVSGPNHVEDKNNDYVDNSQIFKKFRDDYDHNLPTGYNFWILYLDSLRRMKWLPNQPLWSDVEGQIASLCNDIYTYSHSNKTFINHRIGTKVSIIQIFNEWLKNADGRSSVLDTSDAYDSYQGCIDKFLYSYPNNAPQYQHKAKDTLCLAVIIAFCYCGLSKYIHDQKILVDYTQVFYNFLFKQLRSFENLFSKYLQDDINNNLTKKRFNDNRHTGLKLLTKGDDSYNLITFNYTGNPNNGNSKCNKYLAIHSDVNHTPIIGISDDICRDTKGNDKGFFEFSKVSQILSLTENDPTIKNMINGVTCMKFYGHSLALADYPYFKYIFDECNLRNSNIRLIFYYTNYGKDNTDYTKSVHRMKQVKRVYKLLDRYGNSIGDTSLKMKLILERRVKIRCIDGWENKKN